jgi:hypothetical protein
LYSNCLTSSLQLAFLIAWANLWFFIIFFTAKSSTTIVWFSRTSRVVSLWRKSLRASAIWAWIASNLLPSLFPIIWTFNPARQCFLSLSQLAF